MINIIENVEVKENEIDVEEKQIQLAKEILEFYGYTVSKIVDEGLFDSKKKKADINNAKREIRGKIEVITKNKAFNEIAYNLGSVLMHAVSEYGAIANKDRNISTTSKYKTFDSQAKIVIAIYEDTIKTLKKPNSLSQSYSVIDRGARKILGSDNYSSSNTYNKLHDCSEIIQQISKIPAEDKIYKQAKQEIIDEFYRTLVSTLNDGLAIIKKKGGRIFE